ncbi:AAA family ATPase [Vibrio vulnificus]|uniref:AAA family ATPase n=1 Tax=Vibrio vulnificus TaxID=672 RepID=UPI0039814BB1
MFNFIIEGGNATGKSTLLERLVSELPQYKTLYSSDSSFEPIRSNAYRNWNDDASLHFYIAANLQTFTKYDKEPILMDRSLFSTFAMFLARRDEKNWAECLTLFQSVIERMPFFGGVIHLTASAEVRRQRIALKEGEAKQADLRELDWEDKKQRAREFLLENSGIQSCIIDTSDLTVEQVAENARKFIEARNQLPKPILSIFTGLPGCGKSTLSRTFKEDGCCILSSDDIREENFGCVFSPEIRVKVFVLLQNEAIKRLKQGCNVVLDTTFLNDQEERTRFVCFIKENVKNVTINAHVFPANLAISLQRDSMRENIRRVGFEVINNLASQYIEPILQEGFDNVFVIDSANI